MVERESSVTAGAACGSAIVLGAFPATSWAAPDRSVGDDPHGTANGEEEIGVGQMGGGCTRTPPEGVTCMPVVGGAGVGQDGEGEAVTLAPFGIGIEGGETYTEGTAIGVEVIPYGVATAQVGGHPEGGMPISPAKGYTIPLAVPQPASRPIPLPSPPTIGYTGVIVIGMAGTEGSLMVVWPTDGVSPSLLERRDPPVGLRCSLSGMGVAAVQGPAAEEALTGTGGAGTT